MLLQEYSFRFHLDEDGLGPETLDPFHSAHSDEFYDVYSDAYYDTGTP